SQCRTRSSTMSPPKEHCASQKRNRQSAGRDGTSSKVIDRIAPFSAIETPQLKVSWTSIASFSRSTPSGAVHRIRAVLISATSELLGRKYEECVHRARDVHAKHDHRKSRPDDCNPTGQRYRRHVFEARFRVSERHAVHLQHDPDESENDQGRQNGHHESVPSPHTRRQDRILAQENRKRRRSGD